MMDVQLPCLITGGYPQACKAPDFFAQLFTILRMPRSGDLGKLIQWVLKFHGILQTFQSNSRNLHIIHLPLFSFELLYIPINHPISAYGTCFTIIYH